MLKRILLAVAFIGLIGWAIYDFVIDKEPEQKEASDGATIYAEPESGASNTPEVNKDGGEDEVGVRVGNIAPDFTLETLAGDVVTLSDYRGERVILNFWATWCPPCRAEMPDMQQFYETEDVVILGVNLTGTQNEAKDVPGFIDEFGITFPVLLDDELDVSMLYQIQPIPTTYMINETGHIQDKILGPMTYEMMEQKITAME